VELVGPTRLVFVRQEIFSGAERYSWVDLRFFKFSEGPGDSTHALAALLAHPKYQEDYCSLQPGDQDLHGPFRASMLRSEDFLRADMTSLTDELRAWSIDGWVRTEEEQALANASIDRALEAFGRPPILLRLRELEDTYRLDDFDVFGHEWLEYVGLWPAGEVRVLVAAID
jgi:hypothetical protein